MTSPPRSPATASCSTSTRGSALLFIALAGPQLLIPDRTRGVLSVYFSRPLTVDGYLAFKTLAFATVVGAIYIVPQLLLHLGLALISDDGFLPYLGGQHRHLVEGAGHHTRLRRPPRRGCDHPVRGDRSHRDRRRLVPRDPARRGWRWREGSPRPPSPAPGTPLSSPSTITRGSFVTTCSGHRRLSRRGRRVRGLGLGGRDRRPVIVAAGSSAWSYRKLA